jgi:hypothetical protein
MSRREFSDLHCGANAIIVVVPPATADLVPDNGINIVWLQSGGGMQTGLEVVWASSLPTKEGRLFEMYMTVYAARLLEDWARYFLAEVGAYHDISTFSVNHSAGLILGENTPRRKKSNLPIFDSNVIASGIWSRDDEAVNDEKVEAIHYRWRLSAFSSVETPYWILTGSELRIAAAVSKLLIGDLTQLII